MPENAQDPASRNKYHPCWSTSAQAEKALLGALLLDRMHAHIHAMSSQEVRQAVDYLLEGKLYTIEFVVPDSFAQTSRVLRCRWLLPNREAIPHRA